MIKQLTNLWTGKKENVIFENGILYPINMKLSPTDNLTDVTGFNIQNCDLEGININNKEMIINDDFYLQKTDLTNSLHQGIYDSFLSVAVLNLLSYKQLFSAGFDGLSIYSSINSKVNGQLLAKFVKNIKPNDTVDNNPILHLLNNWCIMLSLGL